MIKKETPIVEYTLGYDLESEDNALSGENATEVSSDSTMTCNLAADGDAKMRDAKLTAYRSVEFSSIRSAFGIENNQAFLKSWVAENPTAAKSAGKSGSTFVRSADERYVIKTLIKEEKDTCLHMISQYKDYLIKKSRKTLLNWILFLGRLKCENKKTYFCVLNNVFHGFQGKPLQIFDLKGSTVNRRTNPEKLRMSPNLPRMDLDFERRLFVDSKSKRRFDKMVASDVKFLTEMNIMDYSLIIGEFSLNQADSEERALIESAAADSNKPKKSKKQRKEKEKEVDKVEDISSPRSVGPITTSSPGQLVLPLAGSATKEFFVFGIIDILQDYNAKKKVANVLKSVVYEKTQLSTVHPDLYGTRFEKFVCSIVQTL